MDSYPVPAGLVGFEDWCDVQEGAAVRHVGQQQLDRVDHVLGPRQIDRQIDGLIDRYRFYPSECMSEC